MIKDPNITNKKLGINSDDVYLCEDKETLFEWRIGVAFSLNEIEEKLTDAKAHKAKTGVYVDREWFDRTEKARRLQEILLWQIEHQLIKLNNK